MMQQSNQFSSELIKKHSKNHARVMKFSTPHGEVTTPAFMPVGTRAFVNQMLPEQLEATNSQIILGGNTYHMLVAPGMEVIQAAGGMHQMMNWHKPMLTDSGGFQVFSLSKNSKICKIDEQGAHFKHPVTHKTVDMTPAVSIETQKIIGADIIMAFDQCTPEEGGRVAALQAFERTHRWLGESIEAHQKHPNSAYGSQQALFGIIQGGSFQDLRQKSTEVILSHLDHGLDGIAIGGEVIGFDMDKTNEILSWVRPMLPDDKIRYTMGVGLNPQNLIDVVASGVDIFDCVAPTRNARHGALYHGMTVPDGDGWVRFDNLGVEMGRILIKKAQFAKDDSPILDGCECYTCQNYSRAYLHFLFRNKHAIYHNFASIHNVHVMQQACDAMREAVVVS